MSIVDKLSAPHGGKQSVIRMLSAILCVGTVLLVGALLIGCPSSSSSSSDDGSDTTRIAAGEMCAVGGSGAQACVGGHECNETTQLCTAIGEGSNDCAATAQTTCTATVGTAYTGQLTDGDSDWIQVALAPTELTTYSISIVSDPATLPIDLLDSDGDTADPALGSDGLYTPPVGSNTYIVTIGAAVGGAVGTYSLTVAAAAEGDNACNSMDAEADCDSDGVNNDADEFDRDAARSCTADAGNADTAGIDCDNDGVDNNVDELDGDAGLICTVVESGTGANPDADCDNDGTINSADAFASNGCASADGDGDGHPDMLATVGTPRSCTTDAFTALQADNCPTVDNANQADADNDDAGDVCDVDDDNNGLIEINFLEDLNNIRYDLDGHSYDDEDDDATTGTAGDTAGAPAANSANVVCDEAASDGVWLCGYELARDLDFDEVASYRNAVTNMPLWAADNADRSLATNDGWPPIDGSGASTDCTAAGNTCFDAILDGNGNDIANLFVNRGGESFVGLIGRIVAAGAVRNLTLTAVSVTGQQNTGGLAGLNSGTISASDVSGAVTGTSNNTGGLVGTSSGGTIDTSSSDSAVMGTGSVGGLVGSSSGGTISGSYASGAVTGADSNIGGLVGEISLTTSTSTISGSYASGAVTSTGNSVGGLVGIVSTGGGSTSKISASYASGNVMGASSVGGLVGSITTAGVKTISASYASGAVTGTGTNNIGGLVGGNFGSGVAIATSYWIDEESGSTPPRRVFGLGGDDNLTGILGTDNNNEEDTGETDTIDAQGLAIAQMRASTKVNDEGVPDFSSVAQIVPDPIASPVAGIPTGDFSSVWDYTAGCFPRLNQWVDTDGDGVIDTDEPIGDLLPGQGTPADGQGACAP